MINIDLDNTHAGKFDTLKKELKKIQEMDLPVFEAYKEDLISIKNILKRFKRFKNLIVIGNGGSNTSFKAYHGALVPLGASKRVFIVTTMEPDLLDEIKARCPKRNTLVMPISKSGTTVGVIEAMLAFSGYRMLPVTSPKEGALAIVAREEGHTIVPHPPVGGRFSGLTAAAFSPALFFDINIDEIDDGARTMYKYCNPKVPIEKNPALKVAASLYLLEKKGYNEIFCPIYSSKLSGFQNLIVQLLHESVNKQSKGQTIYCAEAPESQHHTNQRFFGGRKDVLGLFITVKNQRNNSSQVQVPDAIKNIKIKDGSLADIDGVPYEKSLEFEFQGTYQDAINKKIPVLNIALEKISPFEIGEFTALWHYIAVYSAALRGVNPFDQPQVEASKNISFELRKKFKK